MWVTNGRKTEGPGRRGHGGGEGVGVGEWVVVELQWGADIHTHVYSGVEWSGERRV